MQISDTNSSMISQLYQSQDQKIGGQVVQQAARPVQQQGPPEPQQQGTPVQSQRAPAQPQSSPQTTKDSSAAMQSRDTSSTDKAPQSRSIDTYA